MPSKVPNQDSGQDKKELGDSQQLSPEEEQEEKTAAGEAGLHEKIDRLLVGLQKSDISTYVALYHHPLKLFGMNIWMGIGRGIGYLIGFAIGGTILVYILNQIVEINLPIIGDFIAEVVAIVQMQLGEKH